MIKLLVFDVDGCLSDGGIIYSDTQEFKKFNVKDGFAMICLERMGYKSAIITGRHSTIVERRAKELRMTYLYQGVKDKKATLQEILAKENIASSEVAAIGDDLNDLALLQSVGWSFAPRDALGLVKNSVDTILDLDGGQGAVREMIDKIFEADGKTQEFIKLWL